LDDGLRPDAEIIRRIRGGRTEEFRAFIERYQARAYALAYSVMRRREDAEDVVQDAFVKAYNGLHTFSDGAPFWPWIRRITVNCCIRRLPREFPSDEIERMVEDEQPYVDAVHLEVCRKFERAGIREAISRLPESYRMAVVLRYQEDLSPTEIAEITGETPVAIRVRLHRAVRMLTDRLAVTEHEM